ncbi:hypothetical protein [Membranihabitans maritimus]|uniref:hypothetical protein n=1 Tax=Membranihabitans maritimus TaxID=2904244 RepID=UPI001F31CD0C|nr:hypothetical protein [Membranihabitans maritimus]
MKTKILSILQVSILMFLSTLSITAQHSSFNLNREIQLTGESNTFEISIPIAPGLKQLGITVSSSIWQGDISIELYDPRKKKIGNYSVGTQVDDKTDPEKSRFSKPKETVEGRIVKVFENPIPGDWKVTIKTEKSKGHVNISTTSNE